MMLRMKPSTSALLFICAASIGAATDASGGQPLETVTVIDVAPVPDRGLSLELVPANVQVVTSKELERLNALDLTQYLNRSAGSVFINEAQSNPLQPDVQFRGFTSGTMTIHPRAAPQWRVIGDLWRGVSVRRLIQQQPTRKRRSVRDQGSRQLHVVLSDRDVSPMKSSARIMMIRALSPLAPLALRGSGSGWRCEPG